MKNMKLRNVVIAFLLLLFVPSQMMSAEKTNPFAGFVGKPYGSYHYALRDTFRARYYIDNYSRMEEGIAMLRKLPDALGDHQWKLEADYRQAKFDLKMGRCDSARFVKELHRLEKISRQAGNKVFVLRIRRELFDFYSDHDVVKEVAAAYRLEQVLKTVTQEEFPDVADDYYRLGIFYFDFGDYRRAEKLFLKMVNARYEPAIYFDFVEARNYLGLIARNEYHDLDASDRWFRSMGVFRRKHHITEKAEARDAWIVGNTGQNELLRHHYEHGMAMLKFAISKMQKIHEDSYIYDASVDIANALCTLNRFTEAKAYIDTAVACERRMVKPKDFRRSSLFRVMSKYYAGVGQTRLSMIYQDSASASINRHYALFNMNSYLSLVEQSDKSDIAKKEQESHDNLLKFIYMMIIAAMLLIGLAVYIVLYMQKCKAYQMLVKKAQEWAQEKENEGEANGLTDIRDTQDETKETALMKKIRSYMERSRCYVNPNAAIGDVVTALFTNERYISEAINAEYRNFNAFVNEYRIREAVLILTRDKDVPLKQLMGDIGFRSRKTFYNAFKQQTGLSPSVFRDNIQEKDV